MCNSTDAIASKKYVSFSQIWYLKDDKLKLTPFVKYKSYSTIFIDTLGHFQIVEGSFILTKRLLLCQILYYFTGTLKVTFLLQNTARYLFTVRTLCRSLRARPRWRGSSPPGSWASSETSPSQTPGGWSPSWCRRRPPSYRGQHLVIRVLVLHKS